MPFQPNVDHLLMLLGDKDVKIFALESEVKQLTAQLEELRQTKEAPPLPGPAKKA